MKITDVEAIILRQPALDAAIADGSQDDLVVRVHTDSGIVGLGEVDSAPEVVKAVIDAPASHAIASGLRSILIGEDPLDVERLWQKMYRASIYYGRRGVALHAISGIDIALWDLKGKALGKPVSELIGSPQRSRARRGTRSGCPGALRRRSQAAVDCTLNQRTTPSEPSRWRLHVESAHGRRLPG